MESWKICNFDPKANFNINFNISNVGYQGQVFKLLQGPLWPTSCVHISLPSSVTWVLTYNFTRALTQTKGKSKTNLKDSIEEGCSAHEGSNLSFTSAWVVDICVCIVTLDTRVFFLRVRLGVSVSAADRLSAHEKFLAPGVSLSKGTNNLLGLETLQTGHQSRHRILEYKISTSPQRQTVEWCRIS